MKTTRLELEKRFDLNATLPANDDLCIPPIGYRFSSPSEAAKNWRKAIKYCSRKQASFYPANVWISYNHYNASNDVMFALPI